MLYTLATDGTKGTIFDRQC